MNIHPIDCECAACRPEGGVFEALEDPPAFSQVLVEEIAGTIA